MTEVNTDAPEVMMATAQYEDGKVLLTLEDKDRTKVQFTLHPLAVAILSLTMQPAMKLALADMKKDLPEGERGFPDTPEGL